MKEKLDDHISLAHGNGGRFMRQLIDEIFFSAFGTTDIHQQNDAASIHLPSGEIMVTSDGFTVKPLEFPGGNIGSLAVHGTINDLAVAGAVPYFLTLNAFIEEGFSTEILRRLVASLAQTARDENVKIVAGDTKVVPKGEGSGVYFSLTGIGVRNPSLNLDILSVKPGDKVLVSGPVGDHGVAVMLAREEFGLQGDIQSDSASVVPLASALYSVNGLRFMRDPTRGGIATVMHEITQATGFSIKLYESQIPVRDAVRTVCSLLGYDPYYLACEGRIVAIVASAQAEETLNIWNAMSQGAQAAIVGEILEDRHAEIILQTVLGGERFIEELEDDPLPRIC